MAGLLHPHLHPPGLVGHAEEEASLVGKAGSAAETLPKGTERQRDLWKTSTAEDLPSPEESLVSTSLCPPQPKFLGPFGSTS